QAASSHAISNCGSYYRCRYNQGLFSSPVKGHIKQNGFPRRIQGPSKENSVHRSRNNLQPYLVVPSEPSDRHNIGQPLCATPLPMHYSNHSVRQYATTVSPGPTRKYTIAQLLKGEPLA